MDYQIAAFKKRGIYVKLSAHFGSQKLGPADKKYVPYLEEFGQFSGRQRPHHHTSQRRPLLARVAADADPADGQSPQTQESLHRHDLCRSVTDY